MILQNDEFILYSPRSKYGQQKNQRITCTWPLFSIMDGYSNLQVTYKVTKDYVHHHVLISIKPKVL